MHLRSACLTGARLAGVCAIAVTAAAVPLTSTPAHAAATTLNISMQTQQQDEWCWAASGDTIASYYGHQYSQNQFCNLAFDNPLNASCPDSQAALSDDQEAFRQIGISPGNYVYDYLTYDAIVREIGANRPVMSRIQWSSGGGHIEVIYGYDQARNWVYWGDPWPSDNRYNWASYDYYVANNTFSWTHSLDRIGQ